MGGPADTAVEAALQPLQIGHLTLRNRVAVTAHITGFTQGGLVTPQLIDYHVGRARGGVGLIVTETGSVHESYLPQGIRYFAPGAGEGLTALAAAVHAEGACIVGQLNHGGAQAPGLYDGTAQLSASDNDGQFGGSARGITVDEIHELTEAYVRAAMLLAESGYDGCEVHGAHSYLLNHFLSPLFNRRDDEYGGDFERRLRFLREILEQIRGAVTRPFVVGVRLCAEIGPGGLGPQDLADIGNRLDELGLIDYVSFSLGGRTPESMPLMTGSMDRGAGYELEWNELPSRAIDLPTIVTGRYRTLAEVGSAVASGVADVVGMTRAHIAEPQLVAKTRAGGLDAPRPCIGCNECQAALLTAGMIRCAVNAGLPGGRGSDDVPNTGAPAERRVLVAGGGPAGLEAARVAALRGFHVLLAESSDRLGGRARLAAERMPHAPGMAEATAWLEREVRRLGVDVRLGQRVDAAFAAEVAADVVVVATGAKARRDGVQSARPGQVPYGFDGRTVLTPLEAVQLSDDASGRHALVVDDIADYTGIGVAEHLLGLGMHVRVVTQFPSLQQPMEASFRVFPALSRLAATGRFEVLPLSMLSGLTGEGAVVTYLPTSSESTVPADTVVLVTRARPDNGLVSELRAAGVAAAAIGDALNPRNFRCAVNEGFRWESLVPAK